MIKRLLAALLAFCFLLPAAALGEEYIFSFIGDCSIGEAIQYKGQKDGYTWMIDQNGYDWPFSLLREYLEADDYTFANLEVVFSTRKTHVDKMYPLVAEPRYAEVLLHSGVDAVNTVNNHCFDFNLEGYQDTMATLDAIGFPHFGSVYVGNKTNGQDVLLTAEVRDVKIGALGFTYPQDSDLTLIEARIAALREQGCDLVVVALHWGRETQPMPESWQFKYARKVIDMGADVVWGAHPHVLQPVQFYHGGVILYSTGNFTFGTMSSSVDRDTGIFQVTYEKGEDGLVLTGLRVIPCRTTGSGDYRPYELTEEEDRQRVFKKLIYPRPVENMQNLPESFLRTGTVQIVDGVPVP
ncbi:MAG: CapA family protein [Clostridia bacterium]|nr:CapA family protein [Clostridia bacterium]